MVYFVTSQKGEVFYFTENREYLLGRKSGECDIVITDDRSVSKQHAKITITGDSAVLEDCGSRYYTFYRGEKIPLNTKVMLKAGDLFKLGVMVSEFSFGKFAPVVVTSNMSSNRKAELVKMIEKFGGKVVETWDSSCTHLTVEAVMITFKVLHALLDNTPIVGVGYWEACLRSVESNLALPDVSKFVPNIEESLINASVIQFKPERATVFKGKVFIFSTEGKNMKDYISMKDIISKAGGKAISIQVSPIKLKELLSSKEEFLIVQPKNNVIPEQLKPIVDHLEKTGKRTISHQEIVMAVLHCSCEKDCNPSFDRAKAVFTKESHHEDRPGRLLAAETQSQSSQYFTPSCNINIRDTFEDHFDGVAGLTPVEERIGVSSSAETISEFSLPSTSGCKRFVETESRNEGKRIGGEASRGQEAAGVVSKKAKIATTIENSVSSKRKKPDGGFSLSTKKVANPFAINPPKKQKPLQNPFQKASNPFEMIKKPNKADNPFEVTSADLSGISPKPSERVGFKASTQRDVVIRNNIDEEPSFEETKDDVKLTGKRPNPFVTGDLVDINLKKPKKENIFDEFDSQRDDDVKPMTVSNFELGDVTTNTSGWLSKKSHCGVRRISEEDDAQMRAIGEKFKNSIVIVKTSLIVKKEKPANMGITMGDSTVPNFKKFKKVQPLRPQTTVICGQLWNP